jgi:hypothetical protein
MFDRVSKPFASRSDLSWIKLSGDRFSDLVATLCNLSGVVPKAVA